MPLLVRLPVSPPYAAALLDDVSGRREDMDHKRDCAVGELFDEVALGRARELVGDILPADDSASTAVGANCHAKSSDPRRFGACSLVNK